MGEGGAALSGGQRARVAFARAAYAHADALFLDDVFAAVDAHVGRRLWASVAALLGAGRAVVLVTHQVQVLARPQVTRVALLSRGNVVACGPCDGAMRARVRATMAADAGTEARPGAAATLAEEHEHGNEHENEHEVEEEARAHRQSGGEGDGGEGDRSGGEVGGGGGGGGVLAERGLSHVACVRLLGSALGKLEGRRVDRHLIARTLAELSGGPPREDAELKREGLIAAADFAVYLREFGSLCARTLLLLATVVSAAASVAANLFLEEWTKPTADGTPRTDAQERASLGVYVLLGCGTEVLAAVQTVLLTICSLRASRVLHATLLRRLLHAPMAFFDAMASGAILNRFLSDTMNVDSRVPDSLTSLATQALPALCCPLSSCPPSAVALSLNGPSGASTGHPPRRCSPWSFSSLSCCSSLPGLPLPHPCLASPTTASTSACAPLRATHAASAPCCTPLSSHNTLTCSRGARPSHPLARRRACARPTSASCMR